jgi:hypothetical protein
MPRMPLTQPSGRSCSSSCTHINNKTFRQWAQLTTLGDKSFITGFFNALLHSLSSQHHTLQMWCPLLKTVLSTPMGKIPHVMLQYDHQQSFSINVWCGNVHYLLTGPYVPPAHLAGPVYRDFSKQLLPELLKYVPPHIH